jgi:DNA repair protein RadA/Sms
MRVVEPAADLGLALAVASATTQVPVAPDVVAIGEVGLTGELRPVGALSRRLAEAARLGFHSALVPLGCGPAATSPAPSGMRVHEIDNVRTALHFAVRTTAEDQ